MMEKLLQICLNKKKSTLSSTNCGQKMIVGNRTSCRAPEDDHERCQSRYLSLAAN